MGDAEATLDYSGPAINKAVVVGEPVDVAKVLKAYEGYKFPTNAIYEESRDWVQIRVGGPNDPIPATTVELCLTGQGASILAFSWAKIVIVVFSCEVKNWIQKMNNMLEKYACTNRRKSSRIVLLGGDVESIDDQRDVDDQVAAVSRAYGVLGYEQLPSWRQDDLYNALVRCLDIQSRQGRTKVRTLKRGSKGSFIGAAGPVDETKQ